jgi:hypothetical protein
VNNNNNNPSTPGSNVAGANTSPIVSTDGGAWIPGTQGSTDAHHLGNPIVNNSPWSPSSQPGVNPGSGPAPAGSASGAANAPSGQNANSQTDGYLPPGALAVDGLPHEYLIPLDTRPSATTLQPAYVPGSGVTTTISGRPYVLETYAVIPVPAGQHNTETSSATASVTGGAEGPGSNNPPATQTAVPSSRPSSAANALLAVGGLAKYFNVIWPIAFAAMQ